MFGLKNQNSKKWFIQNLKDMKFKFLASGFRGKIFLCESKIPIYSTKFGFLQTINQFVIKLIDVDKSDIQSVNFEVYNLIKSAKVSGVQFTPRMIHYEVIDNIEVNLYLFDKFNIREHSGHAEEKFENLKSGKSVYAIFAFEFIEDFIEYAQIKTAELPFYRVCNNIFKALMIQLEIEAEVLHSDYHARNKGFMNFRKLKEWTGNPIEIPNKNLQPSFIEFLSQFKIPKLTEKDFEMDTNKFKKHCLELIKSVPIPIVIDLGVIISKINKEHGLLKQIFKKYFYPKLGENVNVFNLPDALYNNVIPFEWSDIINFFRFYRLTLRKNKRKMLQFQRHPSSQAAPSGLNTLNFDYKDIPSLVKYGQIFSIDILKMNLTYEQRKEVDRVNKILGPPIGKNGYKNIFHKLFFKYPLSYNTFNNYENIGEGDVAIMNEWMKISAWNKGVITQIKYFMQKENIQIKEFNMDFNIKNDFFNKHETKLNNYRIKELNKWLNSI